MELRKAYHKIASLKGTQITSSVGQELHDPHKYYEELLTRQAILRGQKSRICWLKYGDRNTSFFYATTISRRQNYIGYLKLEDGNRSSNKEEIKMI